MPAHFAPSRLPARVALWRAKRRRAQAKRRAQASIDRLGLAWVNLEAEMNDQLALIADATSTLLRAYAAGIRDLNHFTKDIPGRSS